MVSEMTQLSAGGADSIEWSVLTRVFLWRQELCPICGCERRDHCTRLDLFLCYEIISVGTSGKMTVNTVRELIHWSRGQSVRGRERDSPVDKDHGGH